MLEDLVFGNWDLLWDVPTTDEYLYTVDVVVPASVSNDSCELQDPVKHGIVLCCQITSLCLDGQHVSRLSGLENLLNLRWASFNDNDIAKIEVFVFFPVFLGHIAILLMCNIT